LAERMLPVAVKRSPDAKPARNANQSPKTRTTRKRLPSAVANGAGEVAGAVVGTKNK
jgi:hypothetical protein